MSETKDSIGTRSALRGAYRIFDSNYDFKTVRIPINLPLRASSVTNRNIKVFVNALWSFVDNDIAMISVFIKYLNIVTMLFQVGQSKVSCIV